MNVVFSFKIYYSFSFCSDFNLEASLVKPDKFSKIINNYHIAYQKYHVEKTMTKLSTNSGLSTNDCLCSLLQGNFV